MKWPRRLAGVRLVDDSGRWRSLGRERRESPFGGDPVRVSGPLCVWTSPGVYGGASKIVDGMVEEKKSLHTLPVRSFKFGKSERSIWQSTT